METIKKEFNKSLYYSDNVKDIGTGGRVAFFDIETTGLNPLFSSVILIGFSYEKDGTYYVEQFFAEKANEEKCILEKFKQAMEEFDTVVTYNGKSFDVPFINARMKKNNINYEMSHRHLDLICHVRPNKSILGLSSCSLKNVEKMLDIKREDEIDGEESIDLYYQFIKSNDQELKKKILLHNFEDVYNLPDVMKIFDRVSYNSAPESITVKQKSFLVSLLKQKKFILTRDIDKLTKYEASRLIDYLYSGKSSECDSYLERMGK